jgi:hypothetical protein
MALENETRRCEHATKSGARCRANAVSESTMCFAHDPALEGKRTAARRRGGEQKQRAVLRLDSPEISLRSGSEAVDLARQMVGLVLRGELDPKVANSAGGLLNIFLRALTTEVLERRIEALEAAQTGPQRSTDHIDGAEHFGARGQQS